MAESEKDQRTQEATPKRLEDARRRGEVAMATEVRHAAMLIGALIVTGGVGASAFASLGPLMVRLWGNADEYRLDSNGAQSLMTGLAIHFIWSLLPVFAVLLACIAVMAMVQGRFTIAWARLAPKWSKFNPVSGLSRMFGKRALIEFAKTLAKFLGIAFVVFKVLSPRIVGLDQLVGYAPGAVARAAAELMFDAVRAAAISVSLLALADYIYQKRAFLKRMRMTLQEVKDEHKQSEGDPKIKGKIRQIQMRRSRQRMMAAVPTASVIVTNPTHYAVALKYDHGQMAAPLVIAKGVDAIALRIREIATEANVPIVESPPLARALFASVEIDRPIPIEHYAAVAEIIGYVMRLARRGAGRPAGSSVR
ncbi:flagellar biosynthetic protein FlhB [Novosphingobium sp. PhB165]|uniref:flagellar biosynthesis protein FlhB n=1 Tax=Novosphingobium sp. PhB165 TaxID=2485105 RepID=UPI00104BCCD9|nr:flagellar biosynthesis protein FlhB [Novosphingobium sp. PhB165]TCM17734.1 flagellar biosynthetic protein FlhB [Novosphingobium sp. PhB165]